MRSPRSPDFVVVLLAFLGGATACGGAEARLESRFVAVHNAMAAMGLTQSGPISEGSLPEGADATVVQTLQAGECYTFVALGSGGARDLDVRVTTDGGDEVGRDTTHDAQAAAQVCPDATGDYHVIVHMAEGNGGYTVTSWSGGQSGGGGALARGGASGGDRAGTCESPRQVELGRPVHGSTSSGAHLVQGSCAAGDAPEQVYRVTLDRRTQLSAVLQSGFDGALYLSRRCGDPSAELVCNDDSPDTTRSQIDATLDPGDYYLVVDGYGNEAGEYDLVVQLSELQSASAICSEAQTLVVGQPVSGTTLGVPNYFQATCAGGAQSGDRVYRLDVPARSRYRVRQQSDHDGAVYLRRACDDPTTELACNDDFHDQRHSLLSGVLDSGRYFVFSDGYATGQSGNFTITAELGSETGGSADGEACGAPGATTLGQPIDMDTFEARDDFAGSCGGSSAPDVVYEVPVHGRSRIRVTVEEPEMSGAIYLQRTCGDTSSEIACSAVEPGAQATLEAQVTQGSYFLVLDGASAEAFGSAKVTVDVDDLAALERSCRQAPRLRPGQPVSGSTMTSSDQFQASCAGGAGSNDVVYRLSLARRQIVRLSLESDYDSALHVRRTCTDATTEIACNDDQNDNRHAFIETTLDAGTYFVVVDGFQTGNAGTYTLDVQTSNP